MKYKQQKYMLGVVHCQLNCMPQKLDITLNVVCKRFYTHVDRRLQHPSHVHMSFVPIPVNYSVSESFRSKNIVRHSAILVLIPG